MEKTINLKGPQLILAGPGTGKTTFLISRVIELIENLSDKRTGIVVCTFTRKATEELKVRLYQSYPVTEINKHNIIIGTIHSICFELLARYSEYDYGDYKILSEDSQVRFIYSKLKNLGYSSEKIKKRGWVLAEELAQIFNKITDEEIDVDKIDFKNNEEIEDACKVYKTYKKILKRFKLFDFATIQETLLRELETNSTLKQTISDSFKFYLIDEFQDVNNIQNKIFLKLSEPEYNLTVVGDDDQSIYGFRGSNIEHIKGFEDFFKEKHKQVKIKFLNINYRSTKKIVDFTNKLLETVNYSRVDKQIKANRQNDSHKPIIKVFENDEKEATFICDTIIELKQRDIIKTYNQVGILFRSLKGHARTIIKELERKKLPFKLFGAGDMFNTAFGLEFITLLDFYLSRDIDKEIIFYAKIDEIDINFNVDLTTIYTQNNYLEKLNNLFNSKRYSSCIDLIYDIFIKTDFFKRYEKYGNNIGAITSIVLSFDDFSDFFDPWGLFSYLTYLKNAQTVDFENKLDDNAINLMTIHQAKGLEFPIVFLPSQIERSLKTSIIEKFNSLIGKSNKNNEEDFRVLYVGATRAEDLLIITGTKHLMYTKKVYELNHYLKSFTNNEVTSKEIVISNISASEFRNKKYSNNENLVLSYNKVRLFELCPLAYMYKNEWNLQTVRIGELEFGRNIHKIIEKIIRYILKDKTIKQLDIEQIIEDNWVNANFRNEDENQKFKDAAYRQIKLFIKNCENFLIKTNIFSIEDEFNVNINNNLITGRFDAVFKEKDEIILVEFKTGDKNDYSSQLSFYSICFKEKYKIDSLKLAIYYLKDGALEFIIPQDEKFVVQKISDIASKIRNKQFQPKPSKYCKDCAYNNICDFSV